MKAPQTIRAIWDGPYDVGGETPPTLRNSVPPALTYTVRLLGAQTRNTTVPFGTIFPCNPPNRFRGRRRGGSASRRATATASPVSPRPTLRGAENPTPTHHIPPPYRGNGRPFRECFVRLPELSPPDLPRAFDEPGLA